MKIAVNPLPGLSSYTGSKRELLQIPPPKSPPSLRTEKLDQQEHSQHRGGGSMTLLRALLGFQDPLSNKDAAQTYLPEPSHQICQGPQPYDPPLENS